MRLLEHQARKLLASFNLRFTEMHVVDSPADAERIAITFGVPVVLKAQVPFGGRGKAGAVKFASDANEARELAAKLLGAVFRGHKVSSISVERKLSFERELYAGVTWDTSTKLPRAVLSLSGGISVESNRSEAIHSRIFDPWAGLNGFEGREMASQSGLKGRTLVDVGKLLQNLAAAFLACDALVAEINPLIETAEGLIGLDARIEVEDDAAFRQRARLTGLGDVPSTSAGRPLTAFELEAQEIDASDHRGVSGRVVEFEGDLALLIGGGGASLTVFDAIRRYGGRPANYCEVGGNPTEEKVAALTAHLVSKPGVRKLAVIMNVVNNTRADVMARGVLLGLEHAGRKPPESLVVFRVPGSWEDEARKLLAGFGVIALGREVSLDAAARLAVEKMNAYAA
jgi:succinyl-CoA synthetase beta subunit